MMKECEICGIVFYKPKKEGLDDWGRRRFCTHTCAYVGRKSNKGFKMTEEQKKKLSLAAMGKKKWLGKTHSEEAKIKMSQAKKGKYAGSKHPNWKGGISSEFHLIRCSVEYKRWRKSVYERDGYACVLCGEEGTGRNLNADHIKPFALYPELRLDINNGRTLCVTCHRKTKTYGRYSQRSKVA